MAQCAQPGGCSAQTVGKSKYCVPHRTQARARFKAMLTEQGKERADREERWQALHERAHLAGMDAGGAAVPTPMIVQEHANMADDNSPVVKEWYVPSGPCGFAWVSIRPGNSSYALWLKKNGLARPDSYYGGVSVWVGEFQQSMERKEAYAQAYAATVREAGLKAYAMSQID